ncbi:MAG: hypothetical protein EOO17_06155 [Chloroflexi bacterium]|nr:MAG: hypothetical protein EOO17_06155 [Chloroflexota bacterium]
MSTHKKRTINNLSPEVREHIAENMKERIYATITLLAVIAAHWQTASHHSIRGTVLAIAGAVIALWVATLISARMSYRAVHGKSVGSGEYRRVMFTSAGLLAPAITPIALVLISSTGLYSLATALLISMVVLLLSLFLFSFSAGLKIYTNKWRLLAVSLLEMSVGIGVIVLKLAIGE